MKIVITESQFKKIIAEQKVSSFQDYFDKLKKKINEVTEDEEEITEG